MLLVDAVNYYTPDTPELRRRYRQPRQKRRSGDYPQLRTLSIFDLHTGLLLAQHDFPRAGRRGHVMIARIIA